MPPEQGEKLMLLKSIAQRWNQAGIRYAVAHGLEGYPEPTGRDLDVLVKSDQIDLALTLAEATFREHDWRVAHPPPIWGKRIVAVSGDGTNRMLEVHTLGAFVWRNAVLADRPQPLRSIGPFPVDPWLAFAKRILGPLLSGNMRRFTNRPDEFRASQEELHAAELQLPRIVGTKFAQRLVAYIRDADLDGAQKVAPQLRRAAMSRAALLHPLRTLLLALRSIRRKLLQPLSPCAPIIALVGPDGVGKSATLRALQQTGDHVFLDIIVRHWRPGVLPRVGQLAGRSIAQPERHGSIAPRRSATRFQPARLLYYYLNSLVGGIIRDRIDSSRQRLVLHEGYFLDLAVDPLRFGLVSGRGADLCWRWLPKPDRIILLTDAASRIHARKPQLDTQEIQAHLDNWSRRVAAGQVDVAITADASSEQIAARIWQLIIDAFIEKNRRKSAVTQATRPA